MLAVALMAQAYVYCAGNRVCEGVQPSVSVSVTQADEHVRQINVKIDDVCRGIKSPNKTEILINGQKATNVFCGYYGEVIPEYDTPKGE